MMQINLPIQVATAGEALIDLIAQPDGRFEPCLGGAVFNLTRALARQGVGRDCGDLDALLERTGFGVWHRQRR